MKRVRRVFAALVNAEATALRVELRVAGGELAAEQARGEMLDSALNEMREISYAQSAEICELKAELAAAGRGYDGAWLPVAGGFRWGDE